MDELNKALSIALQGEAADQAVAACRRQIADWGLSLPPTAPLVLDFGLGDFNRVGLIEFWIANEGEAGYCGKFLFVFDGQTCPMHQHRTKHETFFLVRGRVRLRHAGADHELDAGSILPVAPGEPHRFTGIGPALLLEISTPCRVDDNYFENRAIPIGGNYLGVDA